MDAKKGISYVENPYARKVSGNKAVTDFLSKEIVNEVRGFHENFPDYEVTPLVSLDTLAGEFGIKKIWVKDESYRLGLNAFKVLGGTFAIGK